MSRKIFNCVEMLGKEPRFSSLFRMAVIRRFVFLLEVHYNCQFPEEPKPWEEKEEEWAEEVKRNRNRFRPFKQPPRTKLYSNGRKLCLVASCSRVSFSSLPQSSPSSFFFPFSRRPPAAQSSRSFLFSRQFRLKAPVSSLAVI